MIEDRHDRKHGVWPSVRTLAACVLLAVPALALAADLIPTPEFADHAIPVSELPAMESGLAGWINVAVLVVALALASYFALVTRSRRGLFLLAVASLIWFGFYRTGCTCCVGSTQNVVQALFDRSYVIPATIVALFVLPLVFTLFFGRTFCAAVCPLGAIQELVTLRPVRVPSWLDHALGLLPYIYLGGAVIFAASGTYVICRYDPFVPLFRRSGDVNMLVFGGCMLVLGLFVGRPYCRYLCPYGAILALLTRLSKWHARVAPAECIQCRLCEDVCPYGAIQPPTVPVARDKRPAARRRLAGLLALVPVLVLTGLGLGRLLAVPLSKLDPNVRLAERIRLENAGGVEGTTDASEAFRNTGRPVGELYGQAGRTQRRFGTLGGWLGAWIGLVFGVKSVALSVRRRRPDYDTDRARCVSCARCFWYCPGEQVRLGLIKDVSELVDVETRAATRSGPPGPGGLDAAQQ